MIRHKGWAGVWENRPYSIVLTYRHKDYATPIIKYRKTYYYYRDSPGGQRERRSFDRLRDAIADLEASHE